MLKNRSKQNSYHACNFIHNYREKSFCLEHQTKCELIASTYVVLLVVWTLTLKRKNSAKIESPLRHLSQDRFFFAEALGQITIWQFISLLMNGSMIRC